MKKNRTRQVARALLFASISAIATGYASAFAKGGAPAWAPWLLAIGIPTALGAIMALGAARSDKGLGALKLPFLFVVLMLALGFCFALGLPATEAKGVPLFLGLPLRAAIIIYGIGLIPIVVLPVAYAVTFETQTLSEEDMVRVYDAAKEFRARRAEIQTE